ncbi:MAG: tocopherol cyclase family protein [Deltaproteobacteria bacterium]|nr:tocopherol cyclase family protein [Deltaproteobacteria bacterium]
MSRENTVTEGNRLVWNGIKKPFFEVYYLKIADPSRPWSFWARYTLLIPSRGPALAALWSVFCAQDEHPVAQKKIFPLGDIDIFHREKFIQIGDAYLALEGAFGGMETSDHRVLWELAFEDPSVCGQLFPYGWFYRSPLPTTKVLAPRLSTFVSGKIEVDGKLFNLDHCPAHQAHLWGTRYAKRWVWGHCNQFEGEPETVFEGLAAEIAIGPFESPAIPLFCLIHNGVTYRANKILSWFKNKTAHDWVFWNFEAFCGNFKFIGKMKRDPALTVGLEYQGPRGEIRFCHNTMLADLEIDLLQKRGKGWEPVKKFISHHGAAFETVEPDPDPRILFVV